MIRFNANLFRIAFTCSSQEETRYYLKGVFVEPHAQGGVTLTATDCHRLICIRDVDGQADETAIVNLGAALKECKPKRGERRDVVIYTGSNDAHVMLTIVDNEGTITDSPIATAYKVKIDGSYPDYRRVVPQDFTNEGAPGFQGRYIASFGDMACDLAAHAGHVRRKGDNGANHDNLRIFCGNSKYPEGSPALIMFPAIEFAFGILMPVRVANDIKPDVPVWFRVPAKPLAQAAE